MESKNTSDLMLRILYLLSWIIFIGLSIDAGSYVFSACYTAFVNPHNDDYWKLSGLYRYDACHYGAILFAMTIVGVMKSVMFYYIVKLLHDKKLNFSKPFNSELGKFIFRMSFLSLGIGCFSYGAAMYVQWLASEGVAMPELERLQLDGSDGSLFMGIVLLVIAQIFKRGIEIQSENELTI